MKSLNLYFRNDRLNLVTPFIVSLIIVTALFYLDEQAFSFEWMTRPWNYYPFAVWVGGFMLGQLIVASFLYKKLNGLVGTLAVFLLGLPAGWLMSFVLICCCGLVSLLFGWT